MPQAAALFALAFGTVGVLALRRRLLARLAFRSALRRPGHSALVVAGLMVGSAAITAALIGADSTEESTVLNARRAWGAIDHTVARRDGGFFPEAIVERLAADATLARETDGIAGGIDLVGSAADLDRRQGEAGVTLAGFDPAAQDRFGSFTLTDGRRTTGADLGPGEVILSRKLAESLDARPGDRLRVNVETAPGLRPPVLRLAGVARAEGPGAYTLGAVVFAPLDTARAASGAEGINVVRVSARRGAGALEPLRAAAARLGPEFVVRDVKRTDVAEARKSTEFITTMLVAMSVLIMAAGAALVVNLVAMLAEERRSQLGILRALGLTRRGLVTLSVVEGALYSLAAAAAGTAIGVFAGRVVADRFGKAFSEFTGGELDFRFVFSVKGSTVATAFALGAVLTLVVVFFTARRTSRLSIPAAIRNRPEPARERRASALRRLGLSLLAALGIVALAGGREIGRLAGGIALLAVLGAVTRRRAGARAHSTAFGFALAAWSLGNVAALDPNTETDMFFPVFVVAMLTTVFGLSIAAVANLQIAEFTFGLLGRAFTGLRAMLRPPLAYMARRGVRTGLTTGVFALILGMLQLFAVFLTIFRPDAAAAGGYDVRLLSTGRASIALPAERDGVERFTSIPTRGYVGPFTSPQAFTGGERLFIPLYRLDRALAARPPLRLDAKMKPFESDREVWDAVLSGSRRRLLACPGGKPAPRASALVVANFGAGGQCMRIQGPEGPVVWRIAGQQTFGVLDGVFAPERALAPFRGLPLGASALVDLKPGVDARGTARALERALFADGVDAASIRALLDDAYRANRTFFSVIDVLMKMGLVVGILALGIIALRAIIERRYAIGVLRALGYRRWQVMAGLMTEAATTTAIGVVVGMLTGLMLGYIFYRQFDTTVPFGVEWGTILSAVGLVFAAVGLVTLGPAWRASRLPPAEAVRYSE